MSYETSIETADAVVEPAPVHTSRVGRPRSPTPRSSPVPRAPLQPEDLTCGDCGAGPFKNLGGLGGHRYFKHPNPGATLTVGGALSHRPSPDDGMLSANQLAAGAGVTLRQIDYWANEGHLRPVDPKPGKGNARRYPVSDVAVARVASLLGFLVAGRLIGNPQRAVLINAVRGGTRGQIEFIPGLILDLDVLCGPAVVQEP